METPFAEWVWPVELEPDGAKRKPVVSDVFRRHKTEGARQHLGVDIVYKRAQPGEPRLPELTRWFAMPSGRIKAIASGPGKVWNVYPTDRHGISLVIDHGHVQGVGPLVTAYRHLATLEVAKGQTVEPGTPLGVIGNDPTTPSDINHLHFEVWDTTRPGKPGRESYAVDPGPYLAAWGYRGRDGTWLRGHGRWPPAQGQTLVLLAGIGYGGYLYLG